MPKPGYVRSFNDLCILFKSFQKSPTAMGRTFNFRGGLYAKT